MKKNLAKKWEKWESAKRELDELVLRAEQIQSEKRRLRRNLEAEECSDSSTDNAKRLEELDTEFNNIKDKVERIQWSRKIRGWEKEEAENEYKRARSKLRKKRDSAFDVVEQVKREKEVGTKQADKFEEPDEVQEPEIAEEPVEMEDSKKVEKPAAEELPVSEQKDNLSDCIDLTTDSSDFYDEDDDSEDPDWNIETGESQSEANKAREVTPVARDPPIIPLRTQNRPGRVYPQHVVHVPSFHPRGATPAPEPPAQLNPLKFRDTVTQKVRWACPVPHCQTHRCGKDAMEAHIGMVHTGVRFKPCERCNFMSFNRAAFRNHKTTAMERVTSES